MILRRVKVLEHERALVFRNGALEQVLQPGVHCGLDPLLRVKVEVVSIRNGWLIHPDVGLLVKSGRLGPEVRVVDLTTHQRAIVWGDGRLELMLQPVAVEAGHAGLLFRDGCHEATLGPGAYALSKGVARAKVVPVDLREQVVDVAGQEIMTADKVTLRMKAVVTFKVADAPWP